MKTVVNNNMVAHLWAAQSQPHARNAKNSFWFRDSVIYSYGSHYPIARHVNGHVLMTTRKYSNTTDMHKHIVENAVQHLPTIYCVNPLAESEIDHRKNLAAMHTACLDRLEKASRARLYSQIHLNHAEDYVIQHAAYRTLFGLDLDEVLIISEEWKKEAHGRLAAQKEINAARKAETKKHEEQRQAQLKIDLEEWKVDTSIWRTFYNLPVALRVNTDGSLVETSHGARVPVDHAQKVYAFAILIKTGVQPPYQHNGHSLHCGSFKIDSIDAEGTLKAGCHTITFSAMKELGDQLGW
jgi:hypothetical protein